MAIPEPEFPLKIQRTNKEAFVFDPLRKKLVVLTPEEWVRQHVIYQFTQVLQISGSRIAIERQVKGSNRRFDLLIHHKKTGKPQLLVECKSYNESIGQNTLNQASIYNQDLDVEYIVVTNWEKWICARMSKNGFEFLNSFPEI